MEEKQQQQQQKQESSTTTVKMTFDTTRPTHRSRLYAMEREDFLRLKASLTHLTKDTWACDSCSSRLLPGEGDKGRCSACSRQPPLASLCLPLTSTPLHHSLHHSTPQLEESSGGGGGGGGGWPPPPPSTMEGQPRPPPTPHQDPQSSTMQESSSSGSMTGSVCTAYERGGVVGGSNAPPHPLPSLPSCPQEPPTHLDTIDAGTESSTLYLSAVSSLGGSSSHSLTLPAPPSSSSSNSSSSSSTKGPLKKKDEEREGKGDEEGGGGDGEEGGGGVGGGGGKLVSISPWVESLIHTLTGYHWAWWQDIEQEKETENREENTDKTRKKRRRRRKRRNNINEEEEEEERTEETQDKQEQQEKENGSDSNSNSHSRSSSSSSSSRSSSSRSLVKPDNPISYNYEELHHVDHRLKLYLELQVLQEPKEHLLGLVKAVMLVSGGRREFQGLLVLSTHKFYLLEITGQEDDSPHSWLEVVMKGELSAVVEIHSLYQRQGVALTTTTTAAASTPTTTTPTTTVLLVFLADSHRANCFFNFLMEALGGVSVAPSLLEAAPQQEEALAALMGGEEGDPDTPSLLAVVSLMMEGGCSESQYLVVNETELVMYLANLTWYLPPPTTTTTATDTTTALTTTAAQKIHNITAIEVHTSHHLSLHFLEEVTQRESSWHLHVAAPTVAWQVIEAVRSPWNDLFSVELQVTHHTTPTTA